MAVVPLRASTGREPFDRGAWLLAAFVTLLVGLCLASLAYRYTLPTDGWSAGNDSDVCEYLLIANIAGAPSDLRPGDTVIGIEGQPFDPACLKIPQPADWRPGGSVLYTVRRGQDELDVRVPVTRWTLGGILGGFANLTVLTGGFGAVLAFFALGLFTFLNRAATPAARLLFLFSALFLVNNLADIVPEDIGARFDLVALLSVSFFSYAIIGIFFGPTLFAFSLVFPRPKAAVARRPWLALLPFTVSVLIFAYVYGLNQSELAFVATMLLILASILSLIHSGLTMRDAVSRAQLQWSIGGVVVGLGVALLTFVPPLETWLNAAGQDSVTSPVTLLLANTFTIGFLIMGVCLSVAVLRYRLFDINLVIRRTLTYTVLTVLLAGVYFGGVVILESLFRDVAGGGSSLAIVLSTLAIAALFAPLRRRVQGFIDRRFNRRSYDTARTLAAFGARLRDQVDLNSLNRQLLEVVDDTMQPAHLSLWLRH